MVEPNPDPSETIATVCQAMLDGDESAASQTLRDKYPFQPITTVARDYTKREAAAVFVRDGFVDRYSGRRLVFPPVLRVISKLLPKDFPRHPNWKMSESHIAYWELSATVDHVAPIARGGRDEKANWVTTSQLLNSAKGNWTLEELGWELLPAGRMDDWDGLMGWFLDYVEAHPSELSDRYIKEWGTAASRCSGRA